MAQNQRKRRSPLYGMVTAAALSLLLVGPALAQDATDVTVTGGSLGITAAPTVPNFTAVTLDGTAKTTTTTLSVFEVNDARGTGAGWKVTVAATQFKQHDGTIYVTGGNTLAVNSLSMAAPTVAADGTTSPSPTLTAGPYTIDSGTAVKIASAALDTGMGKYDFSTSGFTLSVPSNTYATTYRSDATVSVVTAP